MTFLWIMPLIIPNNEMARTCYKECQLVAWVAGGRPSARDERAPNLPVRLLASVFGGGGWFSRSIIHTNMGINKWQGTYDDDCGKCVKLIVI